MLEKPTQTQEYITLLWQLIAQHTGLWSAIIVSDTFTDPKHFQNVNKRELEKYVDKAAVELFCSPQKPEFLVEARTAIRTTKEFLAKSDQYAQNDNN